MEYAMSEDQEKKTTEVNDVSPSCLSHLVGQQGVKAQVSVAIEAAFADQRRFDHGLLVGPPGLGKSAMAAVIAREMAADFTEVLGQSLKNLAELHAVLLRMKAGAILHIDEAHQLDKKTQTALYLALDKSRIFLEGRSSKLPESLYLADFTLLLSSTDEYSILQPLRDRMRLNLRFDFYGVDELVEVVRQRAKALRWDVPDEILPQIACRARGTPRLALRLLQASRRVCRAAGQSSITREHFQRACTLEEIDALGLGPVEQKYLSVLEAGATRLNVVASILGLPARTISTVQEPFLIRSGLLTKDGSGKRELTAPGREHVQRLRAEKEQGG